jgi:hypothetical protein
VEEVDGYSPDILDIRREALDRTIDREYDREEGGGGREVHA